MPPAETTRLVTKNTLAAGLFKCGLIIDYSLRHFGLQIKSTVLPLVRIGLASKCCRVMVLMCEITLVLQPPLVYAQLGWLAEPTVH